MNCKFLSFKFLTLNELGAFEAFSAPEAVKASSLFYNVY
jgi:hypothetical protein